MTSTMRRRLRWALRGALVLGAAALLLGTLFTVVIVSAMGSAGDDTTGSFWLLTLAWTWLVWGVGGLFFGAVLGTFASMIWRDEEA
jgi:ABC-type multidrug transport system fused ATPase/permease subunit